MCSYISAISFSTYVRKVFYDREQKYDCHNIIQSIVKSMIESKHLKITDICLVKNS